MSIFSQYWEKQGHIMLYSALVFFSLILLSPKVTHASNLWTMPVTATSASGYFISDSNFLVPSTPTDPIYETFCFTTSVSNCDTNSSNGVYNSHVNGTRGTNAGWLSDQLTNYFAPTIPAYYYVNFANQTCTAFNGFGDCTNFNPSSASQDGYATWYWNGATWETIQGSGTSTRTRIISFSPPDHSTTSNSVNFTLHAYINADDIGRFIGIKILFHNIDQNTILGGLASPYDIYLFEGQATSSGDFFYATTTTLADGNYRINAQLTRSYFNGWFRNPFAPVDEDISHQFIVNQETFVGHVSQSSYTELGQALGTYNATSTGALAGSCSPVANNVSTAFLNMGFDPLKCLAFLFIPDGKQLDDSITSFTNGVTSRKPIGYFTRFIAIISNNATGTLPSFTTHLDYSSTSSSTLAFDMQDTIIGAGNLLNSITDPRYHKTIREVTEPFVQLVIGLLVLFTIINDITKMVRSKQYD